MPRIQTSGLCRACKRRFAGQVIGRHLASCPERPRGSFHAFDLRVFSGPFWLYLEASAQATLADLDRLLRDLWVECCGHLSAFEISGTRYQSDLEEIDGMWEEMFEPELDRGMDAPLGRILRPGLKFSYEYDFGTTTDLQLRVLSERRGPSGKPRISILARNDPPNFPCSTCGVPPARTICSECQSALCSACIKKHRCDPDMRLPLVNSPRAGACGYTGGTEEETA